MTPTFPPAEMLAILDLLPKIDGRRPHVEITNGDVTLEISSGDYRLARKFNPDDDTMEQGVQLIVEGIEGKFWNLDEYVAMLGLDDDPDAGIERLLEDVMAKLDEYGYSAALDAMRELNGSEPASDCEVCDACSGVGWLVPSDTVSDFTTERCDNCEIFDGDIEAAIVAARITNHTYVGWHDQHAGWRTITTVLDEAPAGALVIPEGDVWVLNDIVDEEPF